MPRPDFDLAAAARQEMIDHGFTPDFPPEVDKQVAALAAQAAVPGDPALRDLRKLLWSSIDNDTSRDLDQIGLPSSSRARARDDRDRRRRDVKIGSPTPSRGCRNDVRLPA